VIWQMNGFVKELTQSIGVVSTDWTIQ
jgi:hypothetical protein